MPPSPPFPSFIPFPYPLSPSSFRLLISLFFLLPFLPHLTHLSSPPPSLPPPFPSPVPLPIASPIPSPPSPSSPFLSFPSPSPYQLPQSLSFYPSPPFRVRPSLFRSSVGHALRLPCLLPPPPTPMSRVPSHYRVYWQVSIPLSFLLFSISICLPVPLFASPRAHSPLSIEPRLPTYINILSLPVCSLIFLSLPFFLIFPSLHPFRFPFFLQPLFFLSLTFCPFPPSFDPLLSFPFPSRPFPFLPLSSFPFPLFPILTPSSFPFLSFPFSSPVIFFPFPLFPFLTPLLPPPSLPLLTPALSSPPSLCRPFPSSPPPSSSPLLPPSSSSPSSLSSPLPSSLSPLLLSSPSSPSSLPPPSSLPSPSHCLAVPLAAMQTSPAELAMVPSGHSHTGRCSLETQRPPLSDPWHGVRIGQGSTQTPPRQNLSWGHSPSDAQENSAARGGKRNMLGTCAGN
ncbi:hypothetical protein C7M84_015010 [Penaeus vannamei]|uniref:Uncharacterized protein n=1 Tax=Penaeus vannamei TaxID=6689 RepID=A0A3R7LYT3_PENVA|nr:hypothetical protein C7M84_015010 [Penaeus vannamei]